MRTSRIPVVTEVTWYSAIHRLNRQRSSHCTTYWKTSLVLVTIQHSNERSDRINCLTHLGSKIQRSQISAFHASYRISLRSSSIHDPSDPPLRVFTLVFSFLYISQCIANKKGGSAAPESEVPFQISYDPPRKESRSVVIRPKPRTTQTVSHRYRGIAAATCYSRATIKNDPSAGSPTETLLRLLVPPVDQVCHSSSLQFRTCALPYYKSKRLTKPTSRY